MNLIWETDAVIEHSLNMVRSMKALTGRDLLPGVTDPREIARQLYEAPFVLVSHGTQADPVLNYGNRRALELWEMTWEELTQTPSRYTAEAPNREERARLLAEVTAHGFIDNYAGVRISKNGRRFRIHQATVWNLKDAQGVRCGQAATFATWDFL